MSKTVLPDIRLLEGPILSGVPFPCEDYDAVGLTDPEEMRKRLGAEAVAREILPCVDSRTTHWRYYLFVAPAIVRGRTLALGRRLLSILNQTKAFGIGRRDFVEYEGDGRRSVTRLVEKLEKRYKDAYGSATQAFWGLRSDPAVINPDAPSQALCVAARAYVQRADFSDFFDQVGNPNKVRHLFRTRLVAFRPNLASFLELKRYNLSKAASTAATSSKLDKDDRLLFYTWAVLQAYYGIVDDGLPEDLEDEVEKADTQENSEYYRGLSIAALKLGDSIDLRQALTAKQLVTIVSRLQSAIRYRGGYIPPVRVWSFRNDGTKRRVFASLRLNAFARLLRKTEPDKA